MGTQRTDPAAVRRLLKLAGTPPGGQATDRELIERFVLDRSEGAFADLLARHAPMVLAVCRRHLRDPHAADDAFQAAFLVLARKAGKVRGHESIGGWLFEVATRVAKKAAVQDARRNTREGVPADSAPEPAAAAPPPPSDLTALQHALDEELQRLPEKLRTPLVLCHLEGLSQDEIARHLGVTDGQLRGRLYRAKEKLRERLVRRGFSLTAILLALTVGTTAHAVPGALVASTLRSATGAPNMIPIAVHNLTLGVIREMSTPFKTITVLSLFGVLGLAAAGFAVHAALADPPTAPAGERAATLPHEPPRVPDAPPGEPDAPKEPEWNDRLSGFVQSVDAGMNKLFVNYDHSAKNQDAGITAQTKILFAGKPAKLADLAPGMRVYVIWSQGPLASNDPAEVRAHWRVLLPDVKSVNAAHMEITFETKGEHGIPLEVTLPIAPDMRPTVDGARGLLTDIPHGRATWVSLSSDRKNVIGLSVFTKVFDVTGEVGNTDLAKRKLRVSPGPDQELVLPVAADAAGDGGW